MTDAKPYTEAWRPGRDGFQFYTRTYAAPSPKAIVIFVHGFAEQIGRFEGFHSKWPQRGITMFAFDMRGFGRTALDAAHRSTGAAYGKTSWDWQLGDIEYWIEQLSEQHPGVPLFLMGNSMGGGVVLGFATRTKAPPEHKTVALLSGIIACSPLVELTYPPPKIVRIVGGMFANIFPFMTVPAKMPAARFSRDPNIIESVLNDPMRKQQGSLRGLDDMLSGGDQLLKSGYEKWPKRLPLLMTHGTADEANSQPAAAEFYKRVVAKDKKLVLYPGAYHDLVHEIDGIAERVTEEYISWVEDRLNGPVVANPGEAVGEGSTE